MHTALMDAACGGQCARLRGLRDRRATAAHVARAGGEALVDAHRHSAHSETRERQQVLPGVQVERRVSDCRLHRAPLALAAGSAASAASPVFHENPYEQRASEANRDRTRI